MTTFEIWAEGYATTGNRGEATLLGTFEAETFKAAVIAWKDTLTDPYSISCVDLDRIAFWGCRLFDNHEQAKVAFG